MAQSTPDRAVPAIPPDSAVIALAARLTHCEADDLVTWHWHGRTAGQARVWELVFPLPNAAATPVRLFVKQHPNANKFDQEFRAYREWLPPLHAAADSRTDAAGEAAAAPRAGQTIAPNSGNDCGLPWTTPALLHADEARRLLVLAALPGRPAEFLEMEGTAHRDGTGAQPPEPQPGSDRTAIAHAAGRFLAALHALPIPDLDRVPPPQALGLRIASSLERARRSGAVRPVDVRALDRATRRLLPRLGSGRGAAPSAEDWLCRVPCHRDFRPGNWVVDAAPSAPSPMVINNARAPTAVGIIDFEHARLDLPLQDFVKLNSGLFRRDPALRRAFVAGYGRDPAGPGTDPWVSSVLALLTGLHGVSTLAWAAEHGDQTYRSEGEEALAVALAQMNSEVACASDAPS